ncbi:hypothetical protein Q5P01_000283 [Channa striata]|uniref:Ig-like domain-containing protein n=1 Tax=Channa striata TaxID=64152 RepID=A0AA88IJT4_CHASR|nr:hypothetical protein Q5P01_000283 [Channa striata]
MLHMLIFISLLFKASASHISAYGNTTAVYGGDAHYRCAVDNPTGVLQVTWQRLFRDEDIENLATYSKRFGQQINEPYRGKVIFTEASLSSASITLRNVTWEDESCYVCGFNVYPDGSKRKQICLTVQGISEVHTSHLQVPSTGHDEADVERVAPPVDNRTANSDHTFTSSSSITLQVPPYWSGHVDCLLNSEMTGQRQETIHYKRLGTKKEDGKSLRPLGIAVIVIAIMFISCILVAVVKKRKGLNCNRRNEHV